VSEILDQDPPIADFKIVRIPPRLHKKLKKTALDQETTVSKLATEAIQKFLESKI
jgi:hypothetical protein